MSLCIIGFVELIPPRLNVGTLNLVSLVTLVILALHTGCGGIRGLGCLSKPKVVSSTTKDINQQAFYTYTSVLIAQFR